MTAFGRKWLSGRTTWCKQALFVYFVFSTNAVAQIPPLRKERRFDVESFDKVWLTVKNTCWDENLVGVDWFGIHDEFLPRVMQAQSAAETRALLREMVGRLKQSHFAIYAPEDPIDDASESARDGTCGLDIRVLSDQAIVIRVQEGSVAEELGVRPGWRVHKIDGMELEGQLIEIRRKDASSTRLAAKQARVAMERLSGDLGRSVSIEFLDQKDRRVSLTIPLMQRRGRWYRPPNMPPRYVNFESRLMPGNIGYMSFDLWFDPPFFTRQVMAAVNDFEKAHGIVIDLRGNRGGDGRLAPFLAGCFVREPISLGSWIFRDKTQRIQVKPLPRSIETPLAILVDALSSSTSEVFTAGMKDAGRARLFGSRTAGNTQYSVVDRLPNGDSFQHAIAKLVRVNGEPIDGVGVAPDSEAIPTRADLIAGRDPALEMAVTWIRVTAAKARRAAN
jgi:carboxyl-terminal processing protease